MTGRQLPPRALVALLAIAAILIGCETEIQSPGGQINARVELLAPARAGFEAVADAMQPHCGTLDCHGQVGRNLRLFGARGLRLDAMANPSDGLTTPGEYDASYWAVVGLEPETLTAVIRDNGADPERLSLIRKARGHERHKGGTLMQAGDDLDRCLISWLTGPVASSSCQTAATFGPPGGPIMP